MMRYFVLSLVLVVATMAQRSPYAGSPDRSYPQVLPQYRPTASNDVAGEMDVINQRIGDNPASGVPPVKYEHYDSFKNEKLIALIKTWPKEKQPFWYLNREAIAAHLRARSGTTASTSSTDSSIESQ